MSFNLEFYATQQDAIDILAEETQLPECVKIFLHAGLLAFHPKEMVHVKALGHLYNKDFQCSTATLYVNSISLKKPRKAS